MSEFRELLERALVADGGGAIHEVDERTLEVTLASGARVRLELEVLPS